MFETYRWIAALIFLSLSIVSCSAPIQNCQWCGDKAKILDRSITNLRPNDFFIPENFYFDEDDSYYDFFLIQCKESHCKYWLRDRTSRKQRYGFEIETDKNKIISIRALTRSEYDRDARFIGGGF